MSTNFSRYIDSVIMNPPPDFKNAYGFQCKASVDTISTHLGLDIQVGNAWNLYKQGIKGYHKENIGSYVPLPWDIVFMSPTKANWWFGHIATIDEGCTLAVYNVIHQNFGSGNGDWKWNNHIKRQKIPAQQWQGLLARDIPFTIQQS